MPTGAHTERVTGVAGARFAGSGEMRALCRAFDWGGSALGPVEHWPPALHTAVDICLGSAFASFVWWGPELVQLYNDAALTIVRGKHPQAFAAPAREAWADVWKDVGPLAEQVLARGEPVHGEDVPLVPERGGPPEFAYFTFSYGAVRDENGANAGLFITAIESTRWVYVERRLSEIVEGAGLSADEAAIERVRAVAERDVLRHQLLQAEEEERRRLSRELHDEAGQHLTALGLGLQALSDIAAPGSEVDRRAAQLRELASTLGRDLHAIAVRLRPKALDDFGLEAALTAHAEEWSRHSGIRIDVHAPPEGERLPDATESAIYRVVQEALTNIARHSGATHASLVLERRDGRVVVVVEDDGRGFDSESEARTGDAPGLGLRGIRERVALLGGTVAIESTSGSGTSLYVRIPMMKYWNGSHERD
jgi:signal transduction histidine kinase